MRGGTSSSQARFARSGVTKSTKHSQETLQIYLSSDWHIALEKAFPETIFVSGETNEKGDEEEMQFASDTPAPSQRQGDELVSDPPKASILKQGLQLVPRWSKWSGGQQMNDIREQVCSKLRQDSTHCSVGFWFRVSFEVNWNLRQFLANNYNSGMGQSISQIAAVTGADDAAVLCSVGEYFASQWPSLPTELLEGLQASLEERKGIFSFLSQF